MIRLLCHPRRKRETEGKIVRTKFNVKNLWDFIDIVLTQGRVQWAIRGLLAAIVCTFTLAHPAHSQSDVWWLGNPCQSPDANTVARCYLAESNIYPDVLYPRDFPNCGIAPGPGSCVYFFSCSATTSCSGEGGTFEVFAQQVASQFYVSTDSLALSDCGCDKNNNNKVSDPISPSNGNVSLQEVDIHAQGQNPQSAFIRYYNSVDPTVYNGANPSHTDLGRGWHHSFTRMIVANVTVQP